MRRLLAISLCAVAVACDKSPSQAPAALSDKIDPASLSFVGKVWLSASFSSPKGTVRIFLPDGTLVMDSCFETYRLSQWLPRARDEIVWREDTAPVEAKVEQRSPKDLVLKIRLPREVREEEYILASVPYVCPDMPR
jgi:hypothetical protein